jgi:hypothetical protein
MANNSASMHNDPLDQDIDQFLFGSDEANTYSVVSNGKNRLEAKKKLARLIHQDVANNDVLPLQPKKKQIPIVHRQVKPLTGSSASNFVTDLRSERKQLRKGWDQLEQPRKKEPLFTWPKKQPKPPKTTHSRKGGFELSTVVSQLQREHEPVKVKPPIKIEEQEPAHEPVKIHLLHASLAFAFVFLLLVIPVKTLWLAESVSRTQASIIAQGKQAMANLQGGLSAINAQDYSDAKAKFLLASEDFSGIKEEVQGYNSTVISLVETLPSLGPKVAFANQVIEVGQNLSQAAAILSATANGDQSVTDSLDSLNERVGNVSIILTKANKTLSLIPVEQLPKEYQDKIIEIKRNLPTFIQQLTRAQAVFKISNTLLGGKKLSRVLFVFQNNRELRATGGFAGSFAVVDFDRGTMTKFDLPGGGTYDVEAGLRTSIIPPYPLQLLGSTWNMWDANWWPDFPTSAKKIAWFYQKSGGTTVDAVIAVNSDVLQQLLAEIGPVDLPDYALTVSSANVYDVLQQEVQVNYDKSLNQPKKVLADLAPLIIEKVLTYPKKVAIGQLLIRAINNHDIQFYSADSESAEQLDNLGWSGKIADNGSGDYLQVVSTNLGGGKSDGYIQRHVDHRADVQANGDIIVTTTLTKVNKAPAHDTLGYLNNVDYVRFYVPQGSVLLSAGGFKAPDSQLFSLPDPSFQTDQDLKAISGDSIIDDASGTRISQELGKTVFGHWMQVKPGETASAYVTYRLPKKIRLSDSSGSLFINYWSPDYQDVDSYSLLIERQSGINNMTFDASVVLDPSLTTVWHDALNPSLLQVNQRVIDYAGPMKTKDFFSVLVAHQ